MEEIDESTDNYVPIKPLKILSKEIEPIYRQEFISETKINCKEFFDDMTLCGQENLSYPKIIIPFLCRQKLISSKFS